MKFLLPILSLIGLFLFSCSESKQELSHEEKLEAIVENYVKANFKDREVTDIKLKIDTITPQRKMQMEAVDLLMEVNYLTQKGALLKRELERKKNSSMSDPKSIEQMESKFEELHEETQIKIALAKEKQIRSKDADSISLSFFNVNATVSVVSDKDKKSKSTLKLPFYISDDYQTLKGPGDLIKLR